MRAVYFRVGKFATAHLNCTTGCAVGTANTRDKETIFSPLLALNSPFVQPPVHDMPSPSSPSPPSPSFQSCPSERVYSPPATRGKSKVVGLAASSPLTSTGQETPLLPLVFPLLARRRWRRGDSGGQTLSQHRWKNNKIYSFNQAVRYRGQERQADYI